MTEQKQEKDQQTTAPEPDDENYPGNKTVDTNAGEDAQPGLGVDEHTDNPDDSGDSGDGGEQAPPEPEQRNK